MGLGSRDTAVNDMWNALTGRLTPEQQTKRAERAQQRLGLTDEQLARARQGLQLGSWGTQQNESAAPEGTAEAKYSLDETPIPTREELEVKGDIPVVDIREETNGS